MPGAILETTVGFTVVPMARGVEHTVHRCDGLRGAQAELAPPLVVGSPIERRPTVEDPAARALVTDIETGRVHRDRLHHRRPGPLTRPRRPREEPLRIILDVRRA